MADKETLAAIGQKFLEKIGDAKQAASFLFSSPSFSSKKLRFDSDPFHSTIGSGSYASLKNGDSQSNILAKIFNIEFRHEQEQKKKRKQDIRARKELSKLKERRNLELILAFHNSMQCDCDEGEVPKKRAGLKGFSMIALGAAGLLFSPDVMAMFTNFDSDMDDMKKRLDELKFEFDVPTEITPTTSTIDRQFTGPKVSPELEELFQKIGKEVGIDPALLKSVAKVESGFDPTKVSPVGAKGIMQLMPPAAKEMGVPPEKIFDLETNLRAGAKYLKKKIDEQKGDVVLGLAAYNAGAGKVHGKVPEIKETKDYVEKVLKELNVGDIKKAKERTEPVGKLYKPLKELPQVEGSRELGAWRSRGGDPHHHHHYGNDYFGKPGENIYTVHSGNVTKVVQGHPHAGNYIEVVGDDGLLSRYLHLDKVNVHEGDKVVGGSTVIGTLGDSGSPGKYHLHFELYDTKLKESDPRFPNKIGKVLDPEEMFREISPTAITIPTMENKRTSVEKTSLLNNKNNIWVDHSTTYALGVSPMSNDSALMKKQYGLG